MPLQWNSLDSRYALLSAAVPAGVALGGSLCVSKNENLVNFIKAQRLSSCIAPSCQYFYLEANVGAAATFGYASYLVYKIGGGFDYTDTTVALGLYGATIASGLVALPLLRTKKAKWLAANTIILTGLSIATTVAFYKIDKISGLWTIPFSVVSLYYAAIWGKAAFGCCGKTTTDEEGEDDEGEDEEGEYDIIFQQDNDDGQEGAGDSRSSSLEVNVSNNSNRTTTSTPDDPWPVSNCRSKKVKCCSCKIKPDTSAPKPKKAKCVSSKIKPDTSAPKPKKAKCLVSPKIKPDISVLKPKKAKCLVSPKIKPDVSVLKPKQFVTNISLVVTFQNGFEGLIVSAVTFIEEFADWPFDTILKIGHSILHLPFPNPVMVFCKNILFHYDALDKSFSKPQLDGYLKALVVKESSRIRLERKRVVLLVIFSKKFPFDGSCLAAEDIRNLLEQCDEICGKCFLCIFIADNTKWTLQIPPFLSKFLENNGLMFDQKRLLPSLNITQFSTPLQFPTNQEQLSSIIGQTSINSLSRNEGYIGGYVLLMKKLIKKAAKCWYRKQQNWYSTTLVE
uniref:Uncharacterized protein n=1 Tax=Meloidogyne enterolobii TaxID=390850 RepID=A0A6V7VF45_MELEN|nr:unnamed protein product [Meloidogyne enterolobii]